VTLNNYLTRLDLEPDPATLPERFPSPFDDVEPHPVVRAAALSLQNDLVRGRTHGLPAFAFDRPEGGKMIGVLLVEDSDGRVGWLKSFSGELVTRENVPGWVPAVFDPEARRAIEPSAEVAIKDLTRRIGELEASEAFRTARRELDQVRASFEDRRRKLRGRFEELRRLRGERRLAATAEDRTSRRVLDNESRLDDLERRRIEAALRDEERRIGAPLQRPGRRLLAMERLRRMISRRTMRGIHDTYLLTNAAGQTRTLRELFVPGEPPWGAADCAAPKLLSFAIRYGLKPLALAEFWWGPPPPGGGRVPGTFFPACRSKCGPILPFLLHGLDVEPRRTVRPDDFSDEQLVTLYEDERVVAVLKPAGMLSVPARDAGVADSAAVRLRKAYPKASRVLPVHRLDLDTSGVFLAALDLKAYEHLQEQFASRSVQKRYVAWVEGELPDDRGTISLPIRLDVDQRPRQVVDFVHGREAVTDWKVLDRRSGRTRVAFFPRTGRTHQLRVHAAHPEGLAAPIVGDRLYGRAGERLLLHAEALTFRHPDGRKVTVANPAPF
jgi:tRNA pseudouridine32 synthase / 23S rRNA pseudouridine746 synthase